MSASPVSLPPVSVASPVSSQAGVARWVQVVTHLDARYGGLSSAVPALGRALVQSGQMDISLAAFCHPAEHVQPAGFAPDHVTFWPAARKPWLLDALHGRELQTGFAAQLDGATGLHIHGLWEQSTLTAVRAARKMGIPYILSAHGMLEPWALAHKKLKKLLYSMLLEHNNVSGAACLHALTQAEAEQYRAFGARCPIAVIPNGVDLPAPVDSSLFLESFPEVQGRRVVLFLARLHPKKGLRLLLEAWCHVAPRFPDAHLVLAGPDVEGTQAQLTEFLVHHRLHASVLFPGMLKGAVKWSAFAAAEAFVLPSYSEGLSVSVLEAMGLGLPVILTTGCNFPEVEHHRAGWQIEPNLDELIAALTGLLSNSQPENARIGARGAALIQSHYTWPRVAAQMAEVYHWAAGGPMPLTTQLISTEQTL